MRKEMKNMKRVLYLILKNSPIAHRTLEELRKDGYNMTLISSESLRHAIEDFPEDHHFFTLRNLEAQQAQESLLGIFVGEEEQVEQIKKSIRLSTNNFQDIHGFMFSEKAEDYEGSI